MQVALKMPGVFSFLFQPYRYKILYGGRGSGKSVNIVKALLTLGMQKPLRILCGREVQKSIRDSVKALLDDEIEAMGMTSFYQSLDQEVRGSNGTSFIFTGLSTQTVDSIKSFANCDICWVEEGQSVSKRSWDVLIPTIRNEASEIWVSLNPELETDETYQRFIANPPPNSKVVQVNYHDNPFFPHVLEQERLHCQLIAPKDYDNIWLGKCKPAVSGAIYYDEVAAAEEGKRICNVPYDAMLKVQVVFDLGWNDAMAISLVQKGLADLRVIEYIEDSHKTLDHYSGMLKAKNLNWGKLYLPHDGRNKDFKTGKSAEEIMQALGWDVAITPNMSIEDGIRLTRMTFPRMYFDKTNTERLVQCAKRYRRSINQQTNEPGAPMHDEWSHGCLPAGELVDLVRGITPIEEVNVGDRVRLPAGESGIVVASGVSGFARRLVEITLSDGRTLRVTHNHKMLTDSGIVLAGELTHTDLILTNDEGLLWKMMLLYSRAEHTGFRASISLATTHGRRHQEHYTEMFGRARTARFLTAFISTILTKTRETTIYRTLSAYLNLSTEDCMEAQGNGSAAVEILTRFYLPPGKSLTSHEESPKTGRGTLNGGKLIQSSMPGLALMALKPRSTKPKRQPKLGIQAKKARNGIAATESEIGKTKSLLGRFVLFAARNILRFSPRALNSATKIAKLRHLDVEGQPVYNLTVDRHHCYVANGFLVSNCDNLRYIAINAESFTNEEWGGQLAYPSLGTF